MNDNNKIEIICFSAMAGLVAGFALALFIFFFVGGSSEKTQPVVIDSPIPPPPSEEQSPQTKAAIQNIKNVFSGEDIEGRKSYYNFDFDEFLSYKIIDCKQVEGKQNEFNAVVDVKVDALNAPSFRMSFVLKDKEGGKGYEAVNLTMKRIAVEEE